MNDLEYIKRTYFFLADHPVRIQAGSIHIWKDVPIFNPAAVDGAARLDPEASSDDQLNPNLRTRFTLLEIGSDYQIIYLWLPEGLPPDFGIPIVQLTVPLGLYEVLAASYVDESSGVDVRVGTVTDADFVEADSALGKPAYSILVKMIKPRLDDVPSVGEERFFDPTSPWYPALFYELRNLYDLGRTNIPKDRLHLVIRWIDTGAATDPDYVDGKPFVQILGLDQMGGPESPDPLAPDGRIDDQYIDYERGLLFFPDLHPFDPDTTPPLGACAPGFGGFNCLDNYARNILRIDSSNPATEANPRVYYAKYPDLLLDARFYIETFIPRPPSPGGVLHQNAPNPFNPGTTIRFDLNYAGHARVAIYDVQGKLVAELLDTLLPAGPNEVFWSGDDSKGRRVASGIYFCELSTGGQQYARRMVLSR